MRDMVIVLTLTEFDEELAKAAVLARGKSDDTSQVVVVVGEFLLIIRYGFVRRRSTCLGEERHDQVVLRGRSITYDVEEEVLDVKEDRLK
jgi:hypothetical protein